jgi:hypothetical protein
MCGGGIAIGIVEQLIFFGAIWTEGWVLLGSWMAFKLASKWEAGKFLSKVLEDLGTPPSKLDLAVGVSQAISQRYVTFLFGTGANIIAAFAGVLFARWLADLSFPV